MTFTEFDRYAIGIPKPDCTPSKKDLIAPIKELNETYPQPFAIISDRINNNGTDPSLYPIVEESIPTLMFYAVVGYTTFAISNFPIEKQFWKRVKTDIFSTRKKAIEWALRQLDKLPPEKV